MKFFIITLFTYYFYNILKYRRGLYMLQQNIYNEGNRYLKWIFRNFKETVFNIDLYTFLLVIATLFLNQTVYMILIILTYLLLAYIELNRLKNEQKKIKFKVTARIKRLITTIFIIFLIINLYIYYNYNVENEWIYFLLMFIFSYLSYCIIYIVNIINKPIEKMVYKYYYNKAKSKIKAMNSLHVVGITGSYGKTSSKEILNTILNTKYISLKTPKSYNTPFGLMITINNMLDKFTNVFIAEMGAYKIGEIKQNCELVNPKYAIITKIGLAHLETFKSEENIQKGKFELVEYLPSDGVAVLNKDDIKQTSYKIKNNCKIIWIGINSDADVKASDIKLSNKGTTFNVKFKDDKKLYSFQTVLLGEHNVYNILGAIALGKELGIEIEKLQYGVKILTPTEHRLELKKTNDYYIIDDAFNANPEGSKIALNVLNMMPGKKIIVTPGMIELGAIQDEANYNFGIQMAEVCDEVILIGEKQTKEIQKALKDKKYRNVHILNDVKLAFKLIEKLKDKETYVLLENDLPDTFNER